MWETCATYGTKTEIIKREIINFFDIISEKSLQI